MPDATSAAPWLASLQVGLPRLNPGMGQVESSGKDWTSGIGKEPVAGEVWLDTLNLQGDAQADLVHHGGSAKAVCVYSADHYPAWREELELAEMREGFFGENFTVAGLTEADVSIGDVWEIGQARLQISQPRQPCWKLARRWNRKDLAYRVQQSGRTGWYCRVLRAGNVASGMTIKLLERPHLEWTIAAANRIMHHEKQNLTGAASLAALSSLSDSWRQTLRRRVEQGTSPDERMRLEGGS